MEQAWLKFYDDDVPHEIAFPDIALPHFLQKTAEKYPDHVATIFMGKRLTYKELHTYVRRFANALHNLGVGKGDHVAIFCRTVLKSSSPIMQHCG